MKYKKTIGEILFHITKEHPELLKNSPSSEKNFSDLEKDLGFRETIYYAKNLNCELAKLCDKYGSDKGEIKSSEHPYPWPSHSYSDYYSRLWRQCRNSIAKIFECGLGTNNPNLPSSMGASGKPGASLRVWRDYFPNALIYGADIDKDILFTEERIKTYYIDQLDPVAINDFWKTVNQSDFDIIIDDGLHTFEAGSCLFTNSIEKLSRLGVYVIEDVTQVDLLKYKKFFNSNEYLVDFVTLYRPNIPLNDNNLVVIRKV